MSFTHTAKESQNSLSYVSSFLKSGQAMRNFRSICSRCCSTASLIV